MQSYRNREETAESTLGLKSVKHVEPNQTKIFLTEF